MPSTLELVEAIDDAEIGNYERLKAFGIRAESGRHTGIVRYTFQGTHGQVAKVDLRRRFFSTGLLTNPDPSPGVCCGCGYVGVDDTPCPAREDGTHCDHWWG